MRNLIQFLVNFSSFFIFLGLELLCLILVIHTHTYHKTTAINASNAVTGNVFETYSNWTSYLHLQEVNDSLMQENARLLQELELSQRDNKVVEEVGCDNTHTPAFTYIQAKVISNTTRKTSNFMVINRGTEQGVEPNMGIINGSGVVGTVKDVSANFATVMTVLNKDTKIGVRIIGEDYTGSLEWPFEDPETAVVYGIPKHVKIIPGDTLVTSGYSHLFPAGIPAGTIIDASLPPGSNFYEINVRLAVNFETIRHVYVVNNLFREELENLEEPADGL